MTGLELMAEYAARESALMRLRLGYSRQQGNGFPGPKRVRAQQGKVADHKAKVMAYVKANPGCSLPDLMAATKLSADQWQSARQELYSEKAIILKRDSKQRGFYWPGENA